MGGDNDQARTPATAPHQTDERRTAPAVAGAGLLELQAKLVPSAPPADIANLIATHPREVDAMMAYVAKTAGNGYGQSVIAAMPTVGLRIAESSLRAAGALFDHQPEVARFPEVEVGAASDAISIHISTSSPVPVDIESIEVLPSGGNEHALPGEFISWEPRTWQLTAGTPLTVDVQFLPGRAASIIGQLRLQGKAGGADVHHQVRLVGRGLPAKPGHRDQREDSVARLQARVLSSDDVTPPTSTPRYTDMLAAVHAARTLSLSHDHDNELHARKLLLPVARRLDELSSIAPKKLSGFDAGRHAGVSALSMSQAAIDDWIQKISLGATIEPEHLFREFEIGAETIRFLTGERDDAKDLRGFDHATKLVGGTAAAIVLGPGLAGVVAEEVSLLALAGQGGVEGALLWGAANAVLAVELMSSFIGVATAFTDWNDFVMALHDPRELAFLVMQIAMELGQLHQARAGSGSRARAGGGASPLQDDDVAAVRPELHKRVQTLRTSLDAIEANHQTRSTGATSTDHEAQVSPRGATTTNRKEIWAIAPATCHRWETDRTLLMKFLRPRKSRSLRCTALTPGPP